MASLFCLTVVKADAHPCGLGPEDVFVLEMLNRLLPLPARSLFSPASFFPLDFVREQELSHPFLWALTGCTDQTDTPCLHYSLMLLSPVHGRLLLAVPPWG